MNKRIICIVGPTASGKTRLGVELAKKFDGEIISADSRQIYRQLNLGTGKDLEEYGKIKYHLIDICDPEKNFTMFDWVERARVIIEDMFERGKLPIVVGGTGLYVQSLVQGFEQVKSEKVKVKSGERKYPRRELEEKTLGQLQKIYARFAIRDSKLDTKNPRRLIRAIEIAQEGTQVTKNKPDFEVLQIGITLPRAELYAKIDKRVDDRFNKGMMEEVRELLTSGVDPKWLFNLGLEYRYISEYIESNEKPDKNSKEFEQMSQELKWKIHAFARRQLTWFRRFPEIKWVKNKKEAEKLVANFLK